MSRTKLSPTTEKKEKHIMSNLSALEFPTVVIDKTFLDLILLSPVGYISSSLSGLKRPRIKP